MPKCEWKFKDKEWEDVWKTKCGQSFVMGMVGSPMENGMLFCCYCGGEIEVKMTQEDLLMARW